MNKKYQIKTVQDMVDCTNEENLENFLIDLKGLLTVAHQFRNIAELIKSTNGTPKGIQALANKGFIWIDDGKHDVKISIGVKR